MNTERVTLDDLEEWWEAHPEQYALAGNASACLVAVPLREITGLPVSFCPGQQHATLWATGTVVTQMRDDQPANVVKQVPTDRAVDEAAIDFDIGRPHDHRVSAQECLAIIRETKRQEVPE